MPRKAPEERTMAAIAAAKDFLLSLVFMIELVLMLRFKVKQKQKQKQKQKNMRIS